MAKCMRLYKRNLTPVADAVVASHRRVFRLQTCWYGGTECIDRPWSNDFRSRWAKHPGLTISSPLVAPGLGIRRYSVLRFPNKVSWSEAQAKWLVPRGLPGAQRDAGGLFSSPSSEGSEIARLANGRWRVHPPIVELCDQRVKGLRCKCPWGDSHVGVCCDCEAA